MGLVPLPSANLFDAVSLPIPLLTSGSGKKTNHRLRDSLFCLTQPRRELVGHPRGARMYLLGVHLSITVREKFFDAAMNMDGHG